MAIDAFVNIYPQILNLNAQDTITLFAQVGNDGNTAASGALFLRNLIIPAGIKVTVIDNGGAVSPLIGSVYEGPTTLGNLYTGLNLPPAVGDPAGPVITLRQFSLTLKIEAPGGSGTISQLAQIFAPGDVNTGNNTAAAPITLKK
jgi:hypothetical protein